MNNRPLPKTIAELLARVRLAVQPAGKKAALARALHVYPPRVTEWLRGVYEPSGETTLQLLHWVIAEEARQKGNRGSASNTTTAQTQTKGINHENSRSGQKKR